MQQIITPHLIRGPSQQPQLSKPANREHEASVTEGLKGHISFSGGLRAGRDELLSVDHNQSFSPLPDIDSHSNSMSFKSSGIPPFPAQFGCVLACGRPEPLTAASGRSRALPLPEPNEARCDGRAKDRSRRRIETSRRDSSPDAMTVQLGAMWFTPITHNQDTVQPSMSFGTRRVFGANPVQCSVVWKAKPLASAICQLLLVGLGHLLGGPVLSIRMLREPRSGRREESSRGGRIGRTQNQVGRRYLLCLCRHPLGDSFG